ncbi:MULTISPECIES: Panacea domain-containing protein [unclassified Castellaniella]|uniref:Panacea domain-containing protein n=1 Tax=unclassified Castellaniella TaxID=2617606 RepID=UPI0033161E91
MIHRRRLLNAIVFFAQNTQYCGKIKLFKLLYLLDFEHFRQTGKSVTGYAYQAWKFGPVPVDLMEEWEQLEADLSAVIEIVPEIVIDYVRQTVKPRNGVAFDDQDFSPRQLRIMQRLVDQYHDTQSPPMIDVTHTQNGAWDRVWRGGAGDRDLIPYELGIPDDDPNKPAILDIAREQAMFQAARHPDLQVG